MATAIDPVTGLGRARVLVVDDDATVAEVVGTYLQRAGYTVDHAVDGSTALATAASDGPDLVVLDLTLPDLDGLEVYRRLRAQRPDLPVIILTARGDEGDRVLGLQIGADDYVTKPFSPRELVLRVQSVLRRTTPPPVGQSKEQAITDADLRVDLVGHRAFRDGRPAAVDDTGVRPAGVPDGQPGARVLPRRADATGVELGVRRPDHRDRARPPASREGRGRPRATHPTGHRLGRRVPMGP